MTSIPFVPSSLQHISPHAIDRYVERVDPRRHVARVALLRMYQQADVATLWQLRYLHVRIDLEATYYISRTSAGTFLMIVKRNTLVTLRKVEQ